MEKLRDYLRISQAAEYLGVSPNTLRNWENAGKLVAHRHPVNKYRLFKTGGTRRLVEEGEEAESHEEVKRLMTSRMWMPQD